MPQKSAVSVVPGRAAKHHRTDGLAPAEADDADLNRLKAELQHVHLPKLAEAGYIDWDAKTQTIRRGPNFNEIAPLLRLIDEHGDDLPAGWSE